MNLASYVFEVDLVVKTRSELSITVLEKKNSTKLSLEKSDLKAGFNFRQNRERSFLHGIFNVQALLIMKVHEQL